MVGEPPSLGGVSRQLYHLGVLLTPSLTVLGCPCLQRHHLGVLLLPASTPLGASGPITNTPAVPVPPALSLLECCSPRPCHPMVPFGPFPCLVQAASVLSPHGPVTPGCLILGFCSFQGPTHPSPIIPGVSCCGDRTGCVTCVTPWLPALLSTLAHAQGGFSPLGVPRL